MQEEGADSVVELFRSRFGVEPEVVARAPGRVNLIGEHTDYNDGFVMPMAIDREVRVAARRTGGDRVRLFAADLGREASFDVRSIASDPHERWSNYERGVMTMLLERGYRLRGFDGVIKGNVPAGAGLSSSAAVEVATGTALRALFDLPIDNVELAMICQRAENEFVGVSSGIMDQFISALGRRDSALFLDCRTLETKHVALPPEAQVIIADTAVKRGLVDSEYNRRREECEQAVQLLAGRLRAAGEEREIRALRDVRPEDLEQLGGELPEVIRRRARHVVTENQRVLESVAALGSGDLATFGRLMNESHESLRADYEVTVPELDVMVEAARSLPGVIGSRMTGAGFGGSTVSLVQPDAVERFMADVPQRYHERTGLEPRVYVCRAVDGAQLER